MGEQPYRAQGFDSFANEGGYNDYDNQFDQPQQQYSNMNTRPEATQLINNAQAGVAKIL